MIDTAMPTPRPARPPATPWGLILGAWTAYGLLSTAQQNISFMMSRGIALPWLTSLLIQLPWALVWALLTPGILWLGRRFPLERGRWPASAAVHTAACLVIVVLLDIVYAFQYANVLDGLVPARPLLGRVVQLLVGWVVFDGLFYWLIIAVAYAVEHRRRSREREMASLQLATQLAQADLQALKMQLHPHFLFNALHTIGSLVRTGDRDNAVRVVAGLGDLLRRVLEGGSRQEVPLSQELQFIQNYLDIERIRFSDRLTVALSVDPDTLEASVPHLILQPVVENAIRHGISPHLDAGTLIVSARRVGDHLHLVVRDDGPGTCDSAQPGIGLTNTRARLERLYGDASSLDVTNAPEGGLEARIVLPFRHAGAERQPAR